MATESRILVVDDDVELSEMLGELLTSEGYAVEARFDGESGLERATSPEIDLVVLDVMLPKMGGMHVLRGLRNRRKVPVIMLTAKGDPMDRILGLEFGADDYLPKPFEPRELLARIKAVLRRTAPPEPSDELEFGALRIIPKRRQALVNDEAIPLTPIEYDLLVALTGRAGEIMSREELATALGRRLLSFDRSIDMHMVHLRRKVSVSPKAPTIQTVRGSGYILVAAEAE